MAKDHLQLQWHLGGNDEEARSGGKVTGWPEAKKVIAQKNCQGKDLSRQLIQHPKLHTNLMLGLCWVGYESSLAISRAV